MKPWMHFVMGAAALFVALSGVLFVISSQPGVQISIVVGDKNRVEQTIDKPAITQAPAPTPQSIPQPTSTPELVTNPTPAPTVVAIPLPVSQAPAQAPPRNNYQHAPREVVEEVSDEEEYVEEYVEFTFEPGDRIPCVGEVIEDEGRYYQVTCRQGNTVKAVEVDGPVTA